MKLELRPPGNASEWKSYHDIRRHVLFELRGHGSRYDANHPDDHRPAHFPLVLWSGDTAVGVIRVDVEDSVARFRRVAILPEYQRRGLGRELLNLAEQFARSHGCTRIESHVDADALVFYERCGFEQPALAKRSSSSILMEKSIPANGGS